jgi:hypothetical protein
MKSLCYSLLVSSLLFAGVASAKHHSASNADRVAATAPASGAMEFNGKYEGHAGRLIVGTDELSFEAQNPTHSMAWNYNVLKKIKTDGDRDEIVLVFHGGETHTFKITDGQKVGDDVITTVATRISAAPRYQSQR